MSGISLQQLIEQGNSLLHSKTSDSYGKYVDYDDLKEWERLALLFLQTYYPGHPQTKDFESLVRDSNHFASTCTKMVAILNAFNMIQPKVSVDVDYHGVLENVFEKFHTVATQLKRRHNNRNTLIITDEYDVQDLLEAILKLFFQDIRPEEWCPSYAGSSKRMDFMLNDAEIALEVKMTRDNLADKQIGEQLIIDISNYKGHPNCKQLYCFVYDPEGKIRNPRGLERDLSRETDGFHVFVYVYPR